MAINFDALPNTAPIGNYIIEKGTYVAEIAKAEMKLGRDVTKAPYLSLMYKISKLDGTSVGNIFDTITEPEKDITKYKLRRFIEALKLPITGTFELKDLTKIVVGKKFGVDIKVDDEGQQPRSVVDVFSGKIYYTMDELTDNASIPETMEEFLTPDLDNVGNSDVEANY